MSLPRVCNEALYNSSYVIIALCLIIVGAFSAYLFNMLHWKIVDRRSRQSNLCGTINSLIQEFEQQSVEYWLKSQSDSMREDIHLYEIGIKSKFILIWRYSQGYKNKYGRMVSSRIHRDMDNHLEEVFDLATGGDFESAGRVASKSKAYKISKKCSEIRAILELEG